MINSSSSQLTVQQINFFKENGYLILPDLIKQDTITQWNKDFNDYFQTDITVAESYREGERLRSVEQFCFTPSAAINTQPEVLNIINQLGGGTFQGGKEQLIIHKPNPMGTWSSPKLAHIDLTPPHFNWRFMLGYTAYGAQTKKNGGCFVFWPGSHLRIYNYLKEHPEHYYENKMESLDELNEIYHSLNKEEPVQFEGGPGTVMIWHSFLLHSGSVNCTAVPRIGIFGRWGQLMEEGETRETFEDIWGGWKV